MSALTETNEAFIQKFVGLSTEDEIVIVPQQATTSTNWELCLLARIITDRLVLDSPFGSSMITAWSVDLTTSMRQVMKNCYLFEFNSVNDLNSTLLGGVWAYKGDLVALSQVHSDSDFNSALIETTAIWVLLLNVPINAFKDEGLLLITEKVGTPVSAPVKGFVNGRSFIKVKVLIKVEKEVKDKVLATHPTLRQITVHYAYEKISRICLFWGKLGHEMVGCQDHARLALLAKMLGQENWFKDMNILAPRKGEWLVNPASALGMSAKRNYTNSKSAKDVFAPKTGFKRAFEKPVQDEGNLSYHLGLELAGEHIAFDEGFFTKGKGNGDLCLNKRAKSAGHNAPAPHP